MDSTEPVMEESMEPAPYGGLMVKTIEDQNEQQRKLQEQAVEINVNGQTEVLRPEAIHIRGVDSLSSQNIEAYINYYVNYEFKQETGDDGEVKVLHEAKPFEDQIKFRVQWINDTSVNIVFTTHEDAVKALESISITSANPAIAPVPEPKGPIVTELIQERETKPYNPVIEFQKKLDLSHRLGIKSEKDSSESNGMDEDESALVLHARMSFQSDRKVKNAAVYSRYYLLHGEPERKPRYKNYKQRRPNRRDNGRDEDLFANKLGGRRDRYKEDEEDLFAHKLKARQRSRSPTRDSSPSRNRSRSPVRMEE